ncbi:MAG: hypothetical protein M5U09_28025 [Gammaproteobacteria bacterium]|nr:hypothetical protein [Gammaproteobacteria bacterium]
MRDRLIARLTDYVTGLDESAIVRRYDYTPKDIEAKIPQDEARLVQARRLCHDADGLFAA